MLIVWSQEGKLLTDDKQILAKAAVWLLGSCFFVYATWWLRCRAGGKRDHSFTLVQSTSGASEKLFQEISEIILFVVLAVWLWAIIPGNAFIKIPRVAGWLAVGFFGMHARILLHELGHLIGAWLVGLNLRKIQVGVGPLVWSCSLANGLRCEWRAWSRGGFVLATHRNNKGFRARQSLFVAAGPLADMLVLWSAYRLIIHTFGSLAVAFAHGTGGLLVSVLFWTTLVSAVSGLVPHMVWIGNNRMWSDGYLLLRLWTASREGISELASHPDWRRALELLQSEHPRQEISSEVIDSEAHEYLDTLQAFQQQQARLGSPLLSKVDLKEADR